jgi:hypothetical protein
LYLRRPYPLCIFCDQRANSHEHAIPAWIAKRFDIKLGLTYDAAESFGSPPPTQQMTVANLRRRIFCKECNAHFKHLEDEAIPILEPMARGDTLSLSLEEQEIVALWGAKTGIALLATFLDARALIPVDHRLSVRQQGKPHEHQWVGYAPSGVGVKIALADQTLIVEDADPRRGYRAYTAVLTFEKLALKLFGLFQTPIVGHVLDGDWPSIRRVWPERSGPLEWPPYPPMRPGNFPKFLELIPLRAI